MIICGFAAEHMSSMACSLDCKFQFQEIKVCAPSLDGLEYSRTYFRLIFLQW